MALSPGQRRFNTVSIIYYKTGTMLEPSFSLPFLAASCAISFFSRGVDAAIAHLLLLNLLFVHLVLLVADLYRAGNMQQFRLLAGPVLTLPLLALLITEEFRPELANHPVLSAACSNTVMQTALARFAACALSLLALRGCQTICGAKPSANGSLVFAQLGVAALVILGASLEQEASALPEETKARCLFSTQRTQPGSVYTFYLANIFGATLYCTRAHAYSLTEPQEWPVLIVRVAALMLLALNLVPGANILLLRVASVLAITFAEAVCRPHRPATQAAGLQTPDPAETVHAKAEEKGQ